MPTYSYACTACDNKFDAVQAFTDDALTTCPECSGRLRKLFNSVGVVFKGSGFYRTDSRAQSSSTADSDSSSSSSTAAEQSTATTTEKSSGSSGTSSTSGTTETKGSSSPAPVAATSS